MIYDVLNACYGLSISFYSIMSKLIYEVATEA